MTATASRTLSTRDKTLWALLCAVSKFDLHKFQGRLAFQKVTYLLQSFGFYFGFQFNWYLYGPYSPELAKVGFEIRNGAESPADIPFTNSEAGKRFDKFLDFINAAKNDPEQLELLASIHFLTKLSPKLSKEQIIERIKAKQPYFSKDRAEQGWMHLQSYGLV